MKNPPINWIGRDTGKVPLIGCLTADSDWWGSCRWQRRHPWLGQTDGQLSCGQTWTDGEGRWTLAWIFVWNAPGGRSETPATAGVCHCRGRFFSLYFFFSNLQGTSSASTLGIPRKEKTIFQCRRYHGYWKRTWPLLFTCSSWNISRRLRHQTAYVEKNVCSVKEMATIYPATAALLSA